MSSSAWLHVTDQNAERNPAWVPSAIIGLASIASQAGYNRLYDRYSVDPDRKPFLQRMLDSSWMPLRSIPDEEYESILKGRIDRLDGEIETVDGQLAALRQQKAQMSEDT